VRAPDLLEPTPVILGGSFLDTVRQTWSDFEKDRLYIANCVYILPALLISKLC